MKMESLKYSTTDKANGQIEEWQLKLTPCLFNCGVLCPYEFNFLI